MSSRPGLSDARRQGIVEMLARDRPKTEIADLCDVHVGTVYRWLRTDETLVRAIEERREVLCQAAIDEIDNLAFAEIKPTAETKFKALMHINHQPGTRSLR